jgi:cytochrome b subunit of formate dehydrogenase
MTRQIHRWTGIAFTALVLLNFAAMARGPVAAWVTYAPLLPLAVMLVTGLWMFFRPYFGSRTALG